MSIPRRLTRWILLAGLVPAPAEACLNDTYTRAAEEEFSSRYNAPEPPAAGPAGRTINPWAVAALAAGAGLAGGAGLVALRRDKSGPVR
jgi:hypothetical protein